MQNFNNMMVTRYRNGVKLLPVGEMLPNKAGRHIIDINDQMQQVFDVMYLNSDLCIAMANQSAAETAGLTTTEDLTGKTSHDFFQKDSADYLTKFAMETMLKNKVMLREFDVVDNNNQVHHCLGLSAPWYDQDDKIIGTMTYSVYIGRHSLPDALANFMRQGLIENPGYYNKQIHHARLSKREIECLQLAVRGKTMREIASLLGLSVRTIEAYMENIKLKFNVATKSELIDLVFDYFV